MTVPHTGGPQFSDSLESGQEVLQGTDRVDHICIAIEDALTVPAACDLDHGDDVVAMVPHEAKVRLDVCLQHCGAT
jgi:hypothetical protein